MSLINHHWKDSNAELTGKFKRHNVPAASVYEEDMPAERDELYAIEALRYLLVGILNDPQEPGEVDETTIIPKDVSELAELERHKTWRNINEENMNEDSY